MNMSNECNAKINKKSWTTDEDAKLMTLIEELGVSGSWTMISSRMGDRSGKQCRERYHNHLKSDINKTPFTKEEDELVNELQLKLGNQWAKISKHFVGRSDNAVKNRWHIINRSKPNNDFTSPPVAPKKPVVPKLALNFQTASMAVPRVVDSSVAALSNNMDLLNLYHSHCEHLHEPTLSSRSVSALVPSSGRRYVAHCDESSGSSSYGSDEEDWLDDLIYYSDCSLNNKEEDQEEEGEEGWSSDDDDEGVKKNYIVHRNVFEEGPMSPLSLPPAAAAPMGTAAPPAPPVVYDAFSEAALTQREDPQEYEYGGGEEQQEGLDEGLEADFLEFAAELMEGILSVKPSPVVRSGSRGYSSASAVALKKFSECLPRTTPRSPACPIPVKKQRGSQPGGSPYLRL